MDEEAKACSVCGGSGLNKVEIQDISDGKKLEPQPIECQHCHGTGKEPN